MPRNPNYDLLFEPLKIGPVTAPNRFYQVPHCTGMGADRPNTLAGMRRVKAEGGWGVVNTEYCSIHPTSDETPFNHCSLWDEDDVRNMALMTQKVHEHGALAGIELWHGGSNSSNLMTRLPTMSPSSQLANNGPFQSRVMDKFDIKELRRYHVDAAKRAMQADYDIVYIYAGHHYILHQFLSTQYNGNAPDK